MSTYTIFTDSSANLPEELIEAYGLEILSLRFMSEGEEFTSYEKGKTTDLKEFYRLMRGGKVFTTSLPYPQVSEQMFRSTLEAGRDLLYIGFSSGLSGTYEAMSGILDELAGEFPDRTIRHVDTLAAAMGEGMLVRYACDMQQAGKPIDEVWQWVRDNRLKLAHWFTVDDLMYLYRGGRVSRTSATAANILSIKPVLHVDDEGHLIPMEKVRSRKRSVRALHKHMQETFDASFGPQHIGISHGDCLQDAQELIALIEADPALDVADVTLNVLDPVIGAHSGPGTLALFYLAKDRN